MPEPIALVPGKSDQDVADDLRAKAIEASKYMEEILNEANTLGFNINMGWGPNAFGKFVIQQCVISKVFK